MSCCGHPLCYFRCISFVTRGIISCTSTFAIVIISVTECIYQCGRGHSVFVDAQVMFFFWCVLYILVGIAVDLT